MKKKDINVCFRLGEERKRLSLNQNRVAAYCEVSVKTIGRWEKNIPIPADKLALLVELGYDITYILTGIKLVPQLSGLDAAANIWNTTTTDASKPAAGGTGAISKEQETWLAILESLTGGDSQRLKQIGLALIGYSQVKKKQ